MDIDFISNNARSLSLLQVNEAFQILGIKRFRIHVDF